MSEDLKALYISMLSGYKIVNIIEIDAYWFSVFMARPVINQGKLAVTDTKYATLEPNG